MDEQLYFEKFSLFGVLASDPINFYSVRSERCGGNTDSGVLDWMYFKNGKLVVGYTIKALYDKRTENEKEAFRQEVGFQIQ